MSRRQKKRTAEIHLALVVAGLAFFVVATGYVIVKLNATIFPDREFRHFEVTRSQNLIPSSPEISAESEENFPDEVPTDEQNWIDAENVLLAYFENINAGNYDAAVALRTAEFLSGSSESYSAQLRDSMTNDISGEIKISEIEKIPAVSKSTTKYFRFRKDAIWSFDGATHSEIKKAAIVERDGRWTIDFFEVERKF